MRKWPYEPAPLTRDSIMEAVDDADWQHLRLSMKGASTEEKLDILLAYYPKNSSTREDVLKRIRVDNYINALKRGGQLDPHTLEIIR